MPHKLPEKELDRAERAIQNAVRVREFHRRRSERTSKQRVHDVETALKRIREAMTPLRSIRGRFPYGPQTTAAEENREQIIAVMEQLKRERMKLWKMLPKKPDTTTEEDLQL
jgi:type VI protein secretion system component VasF